MTQVRTVVHTLAAGGTPLPDILVRTSEVMVRDDLGYATVLIAVIDPRWHAQLRDRRPPAAAGPPAGRFGRHPHRRRHSVLGIELTARPPGFLASRRARRWSSTPTA